MGLEWITLYKSYIFYKLAYSVHWIVLNDLLTNPTNPDFSDKEYISHLDQFYLEKNDKDIHSKSLLLCSTEESRS